MIDDKYVNEPISTSKAKLNNSVNKFRESLDDSPESAAYRHTFVGQARPSFIEESDIKSRRVCGFIPINFKLRQCQANQSTDSRAKNFQTSASYYNNHNNSLSVSLNSAYSMHIYMI